MADVALLYAAIIGASSVLVAIVGALFITSAVDLAGNRRSLTETRKVLLAELEQAELERDMFDQDRAAHRDQIPEADARIKSLKTQLALMEAELRAAAEHLGVWPGLAVLFALTVFGVVLPLAMLAWLSPDQLAAEGNRLLAFGVFVLGLGLVIGYFARIARWISWRVEDDPSV